MGSTFRKSSVRGREVDTADTVHSSPWRRWVDGLHESLHDAKTQIASKKKLDRAAVEALMRSFHSLKGYAQGLGLHGVQTIAHAIESRLVADLSALALRHCQARLAVSDASTLRAEICAGLSKIDLVLARLHELPLDLAGQRETQSTPKVWDLFGRMESVARGLAVELGRKIEFLREGGRDFALTCEQLSALEAALMHAIRNSLDHGTQGLTAPLRIRLSATREDGSLLIECRDFGAGIDPERVREAARARNSRFDAEMGELRDADVLQLLFLPGFSLRGGISRLSGRGYGLNIVREAIETQLNGRARIESQVGQGTCLWLRVPVQSNETR